MRHRAAQGLLPLPIGDGPPLAFFLGAQRSFFDELSTSQSQSGLLAATDTWLLASWVSFMVVVFHLCTVACPSQNENPQELLW